MISLINGMTGTVDGYAITEVLPAETFPSLFPSDNLLYDPAIVSPPNMFASELDLTGVSFMTAAGDRLQPVLRPVCDRRPERRIRPAIAVASDAGAGIAGIVGHGRTGAAGCGGDEAARASRNGLGPFPSANEAALGLGRLCCVWGSSGGGLQVEELKQGGGGRSGVKGFEAGGKAHGDSFGCEGLERAEHGVGR